MPPKVRHKLGAFLCIKGSTTILYQYDATGRKLKETIGSDITDYSANKIYKNNTLYQISHDEGRIVNSEYEYNITDHLGNLRVAFRDSLGVAKITQAYSYGRREKNYQLCHS
ncbi:hypothetical protein [Flectobacillus major]|uniref:hypothetical protein n=1 Tax=Flectobacillus major TaxID=103 RepID=UPI0003F871FE|nr:hypothetical protein [Flectobacillus major]